VHLIKTLKILLTYYVGIMLNAFANVLCSKFMLAITGTGLILITLAAHGITSVPY